MLVEVSLAESMERIPLEDNFEDVLGKALRGKGISISELASASGATEGEIDQLLGGTLLEGALRKVSPALELHDEALIELANKNWHPAELELEGLRQFITPFEDFTVGSFLVWDSDSMEAAMFDTGTNADDAYALEQALGLNVRQLFLTHTHPDHIAATSRIKRWGKVTARTLDKEPAPNAEPFAIGEKFSIGGLRVSTRLTWGHSSGGVTYFIEGLERPVAIVGDALFAQSMGGGVVSYQAALETNRKEIFSLPDETIICPGHGPMSSVGEEKAHNPFFPEFK